MSSKVKYEKPFSNESKEKIFCVHTPKNVFKNYSQNGEKKISMLVTNASNVYKRQIEKNDLVLCFMENNTAWCIASVVRIIRTQEFQDVLDLSVELIINPPQFVLAEGKLKQKIIEPVLKLQLNPNISTYLNQCWKNRECFECKNDNSLLKEDKSLDKNLILNTLSSGIGVIMSTAIVAAILVSNKQGWEPWVRLIAATSFGVYYIATYYIEMKQLDEICEISLSVLDWFLLASGGAAILGVQFLANNPLEFSILNLILFLIDLFFSCGILFQYREKLKHHPLLRIKYRWWVISDFFSIIFGLGFIVLLWSHANLLSFSILFVWIFVMMIDTWVDSVVRIIDDNYAKGH